MYRRWRDSEVPFKVTFGRRHTVEGGVRVDEGEILALKRRKLDSDRFRVRVRTNAHARGRFMFRHT